jgi:polypeptide N-acetylgalactosaminyltransferase
MYTSKSNLCRILILTSVCWFSVVLIILHNSEESELHLKQEGSRKFPKNSFDEIINGKLLISHNSAEVDNNFYSSSERANIFNHDFDKLLATYPPQVYKMLNLQPNVGEGGKFVDLPPVPNELQTIIDDGWRRHQFNEFLSDLISVNRTLMDPRSNYCKTVAKYSDNLPKTSIIIIFHNEAWSTLLRTIHSVMNQSPDHLIEEIILVDDSSYMGKFG